MNGNAKPVGDVLTIEYCAQLVGVEFTFDIVTVGQSRIDHSLTLFRSPDLSSTFI